MNIVVVAFITLALLLHWQPVYFCDIGVELTIHWELFLFLDLCGKYKQVILAMVSGELS